jgi:hypothetical protein
MQAETFQGKIRVFVSMKMVKAAIFRFVDVGGKATMQTLLRIVPILIGERLSRCPQKTDLLVLASHPSGTERW